MSILNDKKWWDAFWVEQSSYSGLGDDCETWYDMVWQNSFDYWHTVFNKSACGKKMLECGCGSGKISQYMAQRDFECTLVDYSENAISQARKQFNSKSLKGEFYLGDINSLDFSDQQFDVVYSGGVLEFFQDVKQPISEMVRVLKHGGLFGANMVPKKFSIQTLANIERTIVYSFRNLLKGRFREVFRRVKLIPSDYYVNPLSLEEYVDICRAAGLEEVVALVVTPFPQLALPRFLGRMYAKMMKKFDKQWKKFDNSNRLWTKIWGIKYTIYGVKGGS